jgi:hypothetical protein
LKGKGSECILQMDRSEYISCILNNLPNSVNVAEVLYKVIDLQPVFAGGDCIQSQGWFYVEKHDADLWTELSIDLKGKPVSRRAAEIAEKTFKRL